MYAVYGLVAQALFTGGRSVPFTLRQKDADILSLMARANYISNGFSILLGENVRSWADRDGFST